MQSHMKRILIIVVLLLGGYLAAFGQEFERMVFTAEDGTELNYRLLRPAETAKAKKFPLIIFLHGLGERGTDNDRQLTWGGNMFLNPVNMEKYPAYVLFPQCPETAFWAYKDIPASYDALYAEEQMPAPFKAVKEMIDTYLTYPDIDRSRVYIMGLSMGGMATYDMVSRFPEIFAAAIPICGAVEPSRLTGIEGVSFRIFHGDADPDVPVRCSREAYKALKEAGVKVEYIEFPGCTHGSWNPAFCRDDFMEWLFKQKKSRKYLR